MPIANKLSSTNLARIHQQTRRHFLANCQVGLGAIAAGLLTGKRCAASQHESVENPLAARQPMTPPLARHVIYLHMAGSPPQHELLDDKPQLAKHHLQPCPQEFIEGKEFAFIKGRPKLLGPVYKFHSSGACGSRISEMIPHIASHADDLCIINSMITDQFNHAPAQLLLHTGQLAIRRRLPGVLGNIWFGFGK